MEPWKEKGRMMEMLQVDRLYEAVAQRGPVCVGLDTDPSYWPEGFAQPGRLSLIHS